ncbi:hypothetical protein [Rubidibacter lacunae]|uniref:hypothetical protein n=1 Tax=Rubidibacter lacunae TaxID=582514 RepID=UPI0012EB2C8A|nr:hypothetical protein [Rubidibacter lacunae]
MITLLCGMAIYDPYFHPPHIYIFLALVFFNGLVFSSIIGMPSLLVGVSVESAANLAIAVLVGLVQWFFIHQVGRFWLLNWQNHKWYWKPLFPILLVGYYVITGSLSISLLALAVD